MQLREGLLAFDHAGRPEHSTEPDTAVFRTSDNTFELVTEDGERLVFDRAEIHAATAAVDGAGAAADPQRRGPAPAPA